MSSCWQSVVRHLCVPVNYGVGAVRRGSGVAESLRLPPPLHDGSLSVHCVTVVPSLAKTLVLALAFVDSAVAMSIQACTKHVLTLSPQTQSSSNITIPSCPLRVGTRTNSNRTDPHTSHPHPHILTPTRPTTPQTQHTHYATLCSPPESGAGGGRLAASTPGEGV